MTLLFSRPGRSIPIFRYINTMSFIGYLQLLKKTSCAKMTRFIRNPVCFGMVSSSFRFSFWCVDSYEQKRPGTEDGSMHMWHPQGSWQANKAVWDVWPFWHVFSFLCGSTYQPKYYDLRFCIFLCIEVQSTIWRLTIVGIICFSLPNCMCPTFQGWNGPCWFLLQEYTTELLQWSYSISYTLPGSPKRDGSWSGYTPVN